jgi:2-oxoisovalerate ferredoxin oxidoreductase alpha subunit
MTVLTISGNHTAAYAAKVARVEVISAYPITPQTPVVEKIAEFCANGELDAKFVNVESEHSALAVCIAASNTGARTFTATSAQGLTLMHELLHWASSARAPVVIVNVNRAMAPPWTVWADHTDSISQRDTGCLQFYCESNQEVFDTIIQAYKICEHRDVLLPAIVALDAFYLSHTVLPVYIPAQKDIDKFLPKYNPEYKIDVKKPIAYGSLSMPHQWFPELKYNVARAMECAKKLIKEVDAEFYKKFHRTYGGLVELYKCDDAEIILIVASTVASTVKYVVDNLREDGIKVGLARLRVFRPFPKDEIRMIAKSVNVIGVLDRCFTFGYEGPFYTEVKASLYNQPSQPIIKNFITGWGGRDVTAQQIKNIFENCIHIQKKGELDTEIEWVALKK